MSIKHEPLSYWQQTVSHQSLPVDLPPRADVLVIGGGIVGTAACYWLARAGLAPVLLEQTMLVYGATGRNAGFVTIGTADSYHRAIEKFGHEVAKDILNVTLANRELLRQVLAKEEIECHYREPGNLTLALNGDQMAELAQAAKALQADGVPAQIPDRQSVQELIGAPLGPEIVGGKFVPECGLVHSARLVQGIAEAAQRHGAHLYGVRVLQLVPEQDEVCVYTTEGMVRAKAVIVATNAWTGELLPTFKGRITPVRGQMLAYAPLPPIFSMGIGVSVTPTGDYWHQTLDGTIIVGGCRAVAPGRDVGILENRPTEVVQAAIEQIIPRLFPTVGPLQIVQRWAGPMAFTQDYLPIIDQVPELGQTWMAGGFSGHGIPFGLRVGQLLAEAVISGTTPGELRPFRLNRATLGEKEY